MHYRLLLFSALIVLSFYGRAQSTSYQVFPELASQDDVPIAATHDKGIIICHAHYASYGFRALRFDSVGNLLWTRIYKFYGGSYHPVESVIETKDHGFLFTGDYSSFPHRAIFLARSDSIGNLLWVKQFKDTTSDMSGWSAVERENGGFVVEGFSFENDITLISVDKDGNLLWQKQLTNISFFYNSCDLMRDGKKFIIESWENGGIARIDSNGNLLWNKNFYQWPYCIVPKKFLKANDGNIIVASDLLGGNKCCISKIDSDGNLIWRKNFAFGVSAGPSDISQLGNGDLLVEVEYYDTSNHAQVALMLLSSDAELKWTKKYNFTTLDNHPTGLVTFKNRYWIAGYNNDVFLFSTDSLGNNDCLSSDTLNVPVDSTFTTVNNVFSPYINIIKADTVTPLEYSEWASYILECASDEIGVQAPAPGIVAQCIGIQPLTVTIFNGGNNVVNNFTLQWMIDGSLHSPVEISDTLEGGESIVYTFDTVNFSGGAHSINLWSSLPNGLSDSYALDDSLSLSLIFDTSPQIALNYSDTIEICQGNSITLTTINDPAYSFQWLRNGIHVGADSNQYTAIYNGNYQVVVSHGECDSTSSTITLVVHYNPPTVNISLVDDTLIYTPQLQNVSYQWLKDSIAVPGATDAFFTSIQPGIYTLLITDTNGCSQLSYPLDLSNWFCSANFMLYPDSALAHHYWAIDSLTGIPPFSYIWSWGDSTYDLIAYPSHIYAVAGFYTICLTIHDSIGCFDSICVSYNIQKMSSAEAENTIVKVDVVDSIPSIPTHIQNTNALQSWSVFPNPVSGNSFVNYSLSTPATLSIVLNNILGNKLLQLVNEDQEAGEHNSAFDARKLANGIYVLRIRAGDQIVSQKVVVMN
ncbi:MAG TPA: T9SS type A sorting domain-containing protein [Chitinophagales bacterium]|nr:T9SS type A sorting domain-containing protein [Chitinophagales bacterium]